MANRWQIDYSYRERPERVLTYGRYPTRRAARAALSGLAARWTATAPGGRVDVDGPDALTLDARTAFDVRRTGRRDALGRIRA